MAFIAKPQVVSYQDSWGDPGFTLDMENPGGVQINFSITQFEIKEIDIDGMPMKTLHLPGIFLPNNEGEPDLPGTGRYIALPQGADASIEIVSSRTDHFTNIEIAPAPKIPLDTDVGPLQYKKDLNVYNQNNFYPESPVILSTPKKVRGVDARLVGITPFQYNPVTKELIVYRDIKVRISFLGGNGHFGEDRLRSRWWDPMLANIFLNYTSLPQVEYKYTSDSFTEDFEYLIITPDNPDYLSWADTIKNWRTTQGIRTGIVTLTEIGGNNAALIEDYIDNAYNTWEIPPAAVLFLGDYGTGGANGTTMIVPVWDGYCISDNLYADVDEDELPDIVAGRLVANNYSQMEIMVRKFIDYETQPPTNPNFYSDPIIAGGWQSDRWFILCAEICHGYLEYQQSKTPPREYAGGSPGMSSWSTNPNTSQVVNYFGPSGLSYIPSTPAFLTDWGGSATRINNDINDGASLILHRDHGGENGWSSPSYTTSNLSGLNNDDLTFFFSINCLTGKFNYSGECFAEALHRYPKRALGVIAATEVSYSFVNDAYVWGMWDEMWPDFDPGYGVSGPDKVLPGFANVYGKYYLEASSWPYNPGSKNTVYYLFHLFGDAFTTIYANQPQYLTVVHDPVIISGVTQFTVTADNNSLIALSLDNELLGVAEGTGAPVNIDIPVILPGQNVKIVVTKQNYYRYTEMIPVVPASGPYVVVDSCIVNDASGNGNGVLDYGESPMLTLRVRNVGVEDATNVNVILRSTDEFTTITDSTEFYGLIPAGSQKLITDGYAITAEPLIPDGHYIPFEVLATDGANNWFSNFSLMAHAPNLALGDHVVSDPMGNNNGILDPGETADILIEITNTGSSDALTVAGELLSNDPYITINTSNQNYGNISAGGTETKSYSVAADINTPTGHQAAFDFNITASLGITASGSFSLVVGQIPVLILCMDPNHNSSPAIMAALDSNGVAYDYQNSMPADLSLYTSIFVCLGIYSNNHVLSSSEGQILADYLNAGGMIYMEGGDTWCFDSQTAVHSMFNINPISDGSSDMGTVLGQAGSFTEGMSFSYAGENNYMDRISNITPAQLIFSNQSPSYGCAVAYDAGGYKTIGTSFEFGGLSDGTFPSTKKELMAKIIEYFGLNFVPVELVSFNAEVDENRIKLKWETASEINNSGFVVERSGDNNSFERIGFIEGKGTTTEKQEYTFIDASITGKGKFYYRLKQVDLDGTETYSDVIEVDYAVVPKVFSLSQNYPNPFNPATTIQFGIPKEVKVTLKIYDMLGSEVATIVNEELVPGYYEYQWNASTFASGVYFYRITAGDFISTKKLMLLK